MGSSFRLIFMATFCDKTRNISRSIELCTVFRGNEEVKLANCVWHFKNKVGNIKIIYSEVLQTFILKFTGFSLLSYEFNRILEARKN